MKFITFRKIGLFILVSLFIAVAINVRITYMADDDIGIMLTNVEALARGEGDGETGCGGSGSVSCNGGSYAWKNSR